MAIPIGCWTAAADELHMQRKHRLISRSISTSLFFFQVRNANGKISYREKNLLLDFLERFIPSVALDDTIVYVVTSLLSSSLDFSLTLRFCDIFFNFVLRCNEEIRLLNVDEGYAVLLYFV